MSNKLENLNEKLNGKIEERIDAEKNVVILKRIGLFTKLNNLISTFGAKIENITDSIIESKFDFMKITWGDEKRYIEIVERLDGTFAICINEDNAKKMKYRSSTIIDNLEFGELNAEDLSIVVLQIVRLSNRTIDEIVN